MSIQQTLKKKIDEKRQGEILSPAKKKHLSKKMYIESYGCQIIKFGKSMVRRIMLYFYILQHYINSVDSSPN